MRYARRGQSRAWGVVTPCHSVRSSFSAGRLRYVQGSAQKRSALTECRVTNGRLTLAARSSYREKHMKAEVKVRMVVARIAAIAFLYTSTFSSFPAHAAPAGKKVSPSQRQNSGDAGEAKRIIRASLIDPSSAQFEVAQPRSGMTEGGAKTPLVCGTYNAKNRFGGYVGRVYFAYAKSARAVFTSDVAKLGADGSSQSLSALGDLMRGTPSMDQISNVQAQGTALQTQVKFWLGQC